MFSHSSEEICPLYNLKQLNYNGYRVEFVKLKILILRLHYFINIVSLFINCINVKI